ncbi:hypothetical protein AM500_09830 [Bacillus sp. FJAT-18017]|uniref:GrpB family protein n=1 Tax=Bacillus sp. FJAT-18017 TaxID=1705566 RepID=UPI0006AF5906|nr:GrpB family protein [Bacillus sp. FJAT-18017]ALC90046.1 hypothetical protein AM500_09830 [Bacillus sp. FJAT-18017]
MVPRKVEVAPYSADWPKRFEAEKDNILKELRTDRVILHHIGSTSVPGLSAKPIIDILAEGESLEIFDRNERNLMNAGYIARGENGIAGRRYYIKVNPNGERLVHLHAFKKGSPHINRHLYFRDYLISNSDRANAYGQIKGEAASKFPNDISAYIAYKEKIVLEIEQEAINWAKAQK